MVSSNLYVSFPVLIFIVAISQSNYRHLKRLRTIFISKWCCFLGIILFWGALNMCGSVSCWLVSYFNKDWLVCVHTWSFLLVHAFINMLWSWESNYTMYMIDQCIIVLVAQVWYLFYCLATLMWLYNNFRPCLACKSI